MYNFGYIEISTFCLAVINVLGSHKRDDSDAAHEISFILNNDKT